jgi:DNA-binding MarR family transcriptional regulator
MATEPAELAALLGVEGTLPAAAAVYSDPAVRALAADPMRPDDLARALGIDIVSMARTLGDLEARGAIVRYPDGRYGVR